MSMSSALNAALSGLTASSRAAELISSNIANAMNPDYSRRTLEVTAARLGDTGQGVSIAGVKRSVDTLLLRDLRNAVSTAAGHELRETFYRRLESAWGATDVSGGLMARVSSFEAALLKASAAPEQEAALMQVNSAAQSLVRGFHEASDAIQLARMDAETQIASDVTELNRALGAIVKLNSDIVAAGQGARDASALLDQRQALIDGVASIIPIRELVDHNGMSRLYTLGGAVLLDGAAAHFDFTAVGMMAPEMSAGSGGSLSGLKLNGQEVSVSEQGALGGGRLSALFALRDQWALQAQSELDQWAADLVGRFQSGGVDTSAPLGSLGLFGDNGQFFDPADQLGLSARLSLNAAVDPDQGGALWRWRSGVGVANPTSVGDGTLLGAYADRLAERLPLAGSSPLSGARSYSGQGGYFLSLLTSARLDAELEATVSRARAEGLTEAKLANGVDSDQELQELLQVERAWAANARVIATIDEMIRQIMEI